MRIAFFVFLIALAGCKKDPTQEQFSAQQNAADDAKCKSFGLKFGTPAYGDCRLRLRDQAMAAERAEDAARAAADQRMQIPPIITTCNANGPNSVICNSQ
jgi:hypothetical protein